MDYVNEGVAQLAHYADGYLAQPENRAFLEQKYGGSFENPRLGLIVGSEENLSPDRLAEAKRALRELAIIDYDSLVHLFLTGATETEK